MDDQQQRYLTNHLGHNMDVHALYYRATSDVIERLDLAKIILLMDKGKIGDYRGRRIEDITMEGKALMTQINLQLITANHDHTELTIQN